MYYPDFDVLSFLYGALYGIIVLTVMYAWNILASWEIIKHDNTRGKHGTDTIEVEKVSAFRACLIFFASFVWPLTLAVAILYGFLRLPLVLYRKSAS